MTKTTRSMGMVLVGVIVALAVGQVAAQSGANPPAEQAPVAAVPATPGGGPPRPPRRLRRSTAGDTAWVLVSTALVLLMTAPGLALFYGGLVRRKNVLSTMMQSFILLSSHQHPVGALGLQPGLRARQGGIIGGLEWLGLREWGDARTPTTRRPSHTRSS